MRQAPHFVLEPKTKTRRSWLRDNWIAFIEQSSLPPCTRSRWPDTSRASIGPKFNCNSAHSRKLIVDDHESRNHFSVRILFRDGLGSEAQ